MITWKIKQMVVKVGSCTTDEDLFDIVKWFKEKVLVFLWFVRSVAECEHQLIWVLIVIFYFFLQNVYNYMFLMHRMSVIKKVN